MDSYEIPSDKQNTVISTIVPRNTVEGTVTTVRNGSAIIAANGTTYTVPAGTLKSGDMVNVNVATEKDIAPTVTTIQPKTSDEKIKQIYQELLIRDPDDNGLKFYRNFDEQTIRNSILASPEYTNKIAAEQAAAAATKQDNVIAQHLQTLLGAPSSSPQDLLAAFTKSWTAGDTSVAKTILADAAKANVSDAQLAKAFGVAAQDIVAVRTAIEKSAQTQPAPTNVTTGATTGPTTSTTISTTTGPTTSTITKPTTSTTTGPTTSTTSTTGAGAATKPALNNSWIEWTAKNLTNENYARQELSKAYPGQVEEYIAAGRSYAAANNIATKPGLFDNWIQWTVQNLGNEDYARREIAKVYPNQVEEYIAAGRKYAEEEAVS